MFGFTRAERMRARLNDRARSAYLIAEDLALQRELRRNLGLAERAVLAAKDDEAMYERLMGAPPPDALKKILETELLTWLSVRDAIRDFVQRDMLPDMYLREAAKLRLVVQDLYELSLLARSACKRPLHAGEEARFAAIAARRR